MTTCLHVLGIYINYIYIINIYFYSDMWSSGPIFTQQNQKWS
jgi:hypothetical protein